MAKIIFADKDLNRGMLEYSRRFSSNRWNMLKNERNREFVTEDAIDLLDKLITPYPFDRLNASQALRHRYFGMLFC